MSSRWSPLIFFICIIISTSVLGHGSVKAIIENLQRLDTEVLQLRMEVPEIEVRVDEKIALAQHYLEDVINTAVPKYIDNMVQKSFSDIFSGRGLDDMVSGYVMNQLGTFKGNLHHLRSKYQVMSRRLKDMEVQRDLCMKKENKLTQELENIRRETTNLKDDLNNTQEMLRDLETVREQWMKSLLKDKQQVGNDIEIMDEVTTLMKQDLNSTQINVASLVKETEEYHQQMNTIMVSLKEELNMTLEIVEQNTKDVIKVDHRLTKAVSDVEKCECHGISGDTTASVSSSTTTILPIKTLASTTASLAAEKDMDLLIHNHDVKDYFQRLNLNRNSLSNFPLRLKNVDCVLYISSVMSLLISEHESKIRLVSFNIDTRTLTTVRQGIDSHGMTVDEMRQVIFMTTHTPVNSISRMMVGGWRYRVIVDTNKHGGNPWSIAVNPRQMLIYACVSNKLLSVDYDGHNVQTLYTGNGIRSVTLDLEGGALYLNSNKKLMKRSLSSNVTNKVINLGHNPYNIVHYNSSIYISNHDSGQISVVYLGSKTHNIVKSKLQIVKSGGYAMCLIPVVGR